MKLFILIVVIAGFIFQLSSCGYPETPMVKLRGLDDKNDIVFLYKKNVTYEEKKDFENSVLYKPYISGYGKAHQDGIADLMIGMKVSDYEGGSLNFAKNATLEQREKIKKAIESSPVIYKVYENVVPNEIKLE